MEFALIAPLFFGLLVAMVEIGIVYLAQNELETAVQRAGRQFLTGQGQSAGMTQSQFKTSLCTYLTSMFSCSGVMIDVDVASTFAGATTDAPTLTYDGSGNVTNTWNYNTGVAGSILVLRVMYQYPVFPGPLNFSLANLSNGKLLMMSTSVFQVEPYG